MAKVRIWGSAIARYHVWLALLILANGLDVATTAVGLRLGIPEGNPLMSSILHLHGEAAMYALKIAMVAGLFLLIQRAQHRYRRLSLLLAVAATPPVLVVINNLAWIASVVN
jgi:Domain of unknown function (DUF5658)